MFAAAWSSALRWLALQVFLGGVFLCASQVASAQANLVFNGAGTAVSSTSSVAAQEAISGVGVTWSAGSAGYVARASTAANAAIVSQAGTPFRLAGTAATRVAANDLAASAIGGLRAGLVGVLASVAITLALNAAQEYWDKINQEMVYAPTAAFSEQCGPYTPYPDSSGLHFNNVSVQNGECVANYTNISSAPGVQVQFGFGYPIQGPQQCPDGTGPLTTTTPIDQQARCPQVIPDTGAVGPLIPQLNANNGPTIAGDITRAGGTVNGSELPSVQLNPSAGPTTTRPDPNTNPQTQTQTHQDAIPTCMANACAVSVQTTAVKLDANGNPLQNASPTVTTTTPGQGSGNPADNPTPCGAVGDDCNVRVDETGTPASETPLPHSDALDAPSTARLGNLPSVIDSSTRDTSLPDVLMVPAVNGCTPFTFPAGIGVVDPCGPMEEVRQVMDYLWAIAGFWIIITMVRNTI